MCIVLCPKHISDQNVLFVTIPYPNLAVNTSSCMKLMQHTRTDSLRFGTFLRNKVWKLAGSNGWAGVSNMSLSTECAAATLVEGLL